MKQITGIGLILLCMLQPALLLNGMEPKSKSVEAANLSPYMLTELGYLDWVGELHAGKFELITKSSEVHQWFAEIKNKFIKPKLLFAGSINHPQKKIPYLIFSAIPSAEIHPQHTDIVAAIKVNKDWITEVTQGIAQFKNPWQRERPFITKYGTFFFPFLGENVGEKKEATFTPSTAFMELISKSPLSKPEPQQSDYLQVHELKHGLIKKITTLVTQFEESFRRIPFTLPADEFALLTTSIQDFKKVPQKIQEARYPADFASLTKKLQATLMVSAKVLAQAVLRMNQLPDQDLANHVTTLAKGVIELGEAIKIVEGIQRRLAEPAPEYF